MNSILSPRSIGISDLREAPARVFEQAGSEAVVVLNHNRPAGYIVSNEWMAQLMEKLADHAIAEKAAPRLTSLKSARKITLEEL